MFPVTCINCGRGYPSQGLPYNCPKCGGLFDFSAPPKFDPARLLDPSQPGIWRWRHTFGLPAEAEPVSLGEGNTPLVPARVFGREVYFKCEFQNPSGSFKDRGSALLAAWLRLRGVGEAVEDSSGNAGASFAAYAARAGIRARIFVPASAAGPKRRQIEAYGADLVLIPGSRSDATQAARGAVGRRAAYASHAWLPFNLPGYATAAYEIVEQLGGRLPGAVVVPAGQGGFLLGLGRGFEILRIANSTQPNTSPKTTPRKTPNAAKLIGVQARACAPLWTLFTVGREGSDLISESATLAEGVRVRRPLRADAALEVVARSGGGFLAVEEQEILPGQDALARLGFYVEPTSAIVWSALRQALPALPDPVVVLLTGSGLKYG